MSFWSDMHRYSLTSITLVLTRVPRTVLHKKGDREWWIPWRTAVSGFNQSPRWNSDTEINLNRVHVQIRSDPVMDCPWMSDPEPYYLRQLSNNNCFLSDLSIIHTTAHLNIKLGALSVLNRTIKTTQRICKNCFILPTHFEQPHEAYP